MFVKQLMEYKIYRSVMTSVGMQFIQSFIKTSQFVRDIT